MYPKLGSTVTDLLVQVPEDVNWRMNRLSEKFVARMAADSDEYLCNTRNCNPVTLAKNRFLGVKGEFMVAHALHSHYGLPYIKPDLSLRHGAAKGWLIDLSTADPNLPKVHIKSCDMNTMRSCENKMSWTFQYKNHSGAGGRDAIFDVVDQSMTALVFFTDARTNKCLIRAILPTSVVLKYLADAFLPHRKGEKLCVYYKPLRRDRDKLEAADSGYI